MRVLWNARRSNQSFLNEINTRDDLFDNTSDNFIHGHGQTVNTEIKLITFLVAIDGEVVYSQQKQDLELTVAQVICFS